MWFNYHTHSTYCDGKSSLAEVLTKAKDLNIGSLGFSSHAPLPFDCKWCMKQERLNAYLDEINGFRKFKEIEIYAGLEIDFVPGIVGLHHFADRLDYTIGSIHFVEKFENGTPWEIDGPHTSFLEGFEKIFKGNIKDVMARYLELTREMVNTSPPSVVGHLDKIKIQNIDNKFFHESDSWYKDEIRKTIDAVSRSGCIVEVNTRGIYQKKSTETYPSPWILKMIHEKNIPITLSSDAHHPDDLINQFLETSVILKQIGFREIFTLHDGQWKPFEYTMNGIKRK
ncbi:histidinol-phosphatase [Cytophagales bacterium WSM2-2]|nr:histidinol-phosphatase [Cytophagales bacterium WSM2-2]